MKFVLLLVTITICNICVAQNSKVIREYKVEEAKQAVATDSLFFYVINNSSISKHLKTNGKLVDTWYDNDSVIHHLNSGIIIDEKLYTCNSNYPESPMASSIEIFDPETLKHIGNHSFGIMNGSATWLDRFGGYWYVAFAHYTGRGSEPGKDNSWSRLVKYDDQWRQIESWIFPRELVEKFETRSNSGGVILDDGTIICTGHDNYEVYILKIPEKGYTLKWIKTISVGSYGQGIAYEKKGNEEYIYGIVRKENKVVVSSVEIE